MENWCCHCTFIYKVLPHFHVVIACAEFICFIVRIAYFFTPITSSSSQQSSVSQTGLPATQNYTSNYVAAFVLDCISSIVPTLTGLFITFLFFIVLCKLIIFCIKSYRKTRVSPSSNELNTTGWLRKFWDNKALRRVIALDCNCPCYRARPRLRFQVRLLFFSVIFIFRIIAIALYASSSNQGNYGSTLAIVAAVSLTFLFLTVSLDLYHYCVWWHYTPYSDTTWCCFRAWRHKRYLPYILIGGYRNEHIWGDESCPRNPCPDRGLEHIATFHSSTYQPQARWSALWKDKLPTDPKEKPKRQPTYIGFHTTKPDAAIKIAQGGFLPSKKGMIGPGVYFARSLEATIGKVGAAGGFGAWIIAEVHMGKVLEVRRHSSEQTKASEGKWHDQYDTCYCTHSDNNLDEFCIKNPETQIIRWITVIEKEHDPKVEKLGLDNEFESTAYGCF